MENSLIVCGGSGAHTAAAFLRLHILGYPLGFLERGGDPLDFPTLFLIDQDAGDGAEKEPTAWQLVRQLVAEHPGRHDWNQAIGRAQAPHLVQATPLPVGPNQAWFRRPYNHLGSRFEGSAVLDLLASERQREIDYSKGMMGSPAIGSLLFRLKDFDQQAKALNCDERFGQVLQTQGRVVVAGSGVGGTGAAVGPTLAKRLSSIDNNSVMAVVLLNWFEFDEEGQDDEVRAKAAYRNRVMRENANSSLEFYGQTLARSVAAVPVGMPERNLSKRRFTGDVGQPIHESFIHAVAALSGYRHFLDEQAYGPGLYLMGAVKQGCLDGGTAIPGGTLQSLAHQAETLARTLEAYCRVLSRSQDGRVSPAIHGAVAKLAEPKQVADQLTKEVGHYREQIAWLRETLGVEGRPAEEFLYEAAARARLAEHSRAFDKASGAPPERVASILFHWVADWVREEARPENGLVVEAEGVGGAHWPDLRNADGLGIQPRTNGGLDRVDDASRDQVLEAFVDTDFLSANGWPHPLAPVEYFRQAIRRRDAVAIRRLELLMVGLVCEELQLERLEIPNEATGLSPERLIGDARREDYRGLAELQVVWPRHRGRVVAFNSPYSLLVPVPGMFEEDADRLWNELWRLLSGAADGADWQEAEEPTNWGEHDLAVRQVRSWVEQQKRVFSGSGSSPPWTKVFAGYRGREQAVPYGSGDVFKVFWGSSSDPQRPLVDLNFPTRKTSKWVPPANASSLTEEELFVRLPELREVRDDKGEMLFRMVEFEIPGREGKVRGWWDEHLEYLRSTDKIYISSQNENGEVILGTMESSGLHATTLQGSRLLSQETVAIKRCFPIEQDPVPGSGTRKGKVLYPDLPIRGDYLDLVETPEGDHLLEGMKKAVPPGEDWQPVPRNDAGGNTKVKWMVRLRGLGVPLEVELSIPRDEPGVPAHWMVWPRFRDKGGRWKAYYIYEWAENKQLRLETLWLEGGSTPRIRRLVPSLRSPGKRQIVAYPVAFRPGSDRVHEGGPPLAFCLRHQKWDEELGLYLIGLQTLGDSPSPVHMAVDFGTSHSVAAVKVGQDQDGVKPVGFLPELQEGRDSPRLSFHVSESLSHVKADGKSNGLLAKGSWLPTYSAEDNQGFLPSELMLYRKLEEAQADTVSDWIPATHFLIPPMDISREEVGNYTLADFKWDTGASHFRGREPELRESYLEMFLELALAELVARHLKSFPEQQINLTFTYPLRSKEDQVKAFQESLRRTVSRCSKSVGVRLGLLNDIGIYDESRAAQLRTNQFGEVALVGDLGGGTLDLFVSGTGQGDLIFPQVADSVRLGGNLLIRQMAENPQGLLPSDGGWDLGKSGQTEAKLRGWMRSNGSPSLFGTGSGGRLSLTNLGVNGFDHASQAQPGRDLLGRYFRLVVEYLARNLAAYLFVHWFPKVREEDFRRLRLSVQLRGNGWRLRYQKESFRKATQKIQEQVKARLTELWKEIPDNPYPSPGTEAEWAAALDSEVANPKLEPVLNAVGQAMSFEEVKSHWHTHTLVDLEVFRGNGDREEIEWFRRIPFDTGGSKDVEVNGISPPLVLSSSREDRYFQISKLKDQERGAINTALKTGEAVVDPDQGLYRAPVAALVWEAVFGSRAFWPGREGE